MGKYLHVVLVGLPTGGTSYPRLLVCWARCPAGGGSLCTHIEIGYTLIGLGRDILLFDWDGIYSYWIGRGYTLISL